MNRLLRIATATTALCALAIASPVVHKFELWGTASRTYGEKVSLYWGWTNGFFQARGQTGAGLLECLQGIDYDQAVAMIDKHYKDHPEKWSRPMGEQFIEALTVRGGPCDGKSPF